MNTISKTVEKPRKLLLKQHDKDEPEQCEEESPPEISSNITEIQSIAQNCNNKAFLLQMAQTIEHDKIEAQQPLELQPMKGHKVYLMYPKLIPKAENSVFRTKYYSL